MKKLLCLLTLFLFIFTPFADAKSAKRDINSVIEDFNVDSGSIAISFKNIDNGKTAYSMNDKILINPASVQKILTTPAIVDTLGEDYEFTTEVYSRGEDSYLIKLGADPYLSSKNLKELVSVLSPDTKKLLIDDSIIDNKIWGEGWQWDDDMNILMPRFSSYNLDKNLIKLTIMPTKKGQFATIINPSKYPLVFFNNIETSDKTNIKTHRDSAISENTLVLSGTVARATTIYIPTTNLKRYFNVQLTKALEDRSLYMKEPVKAGKINPNDTLEQKLTHSIDIAVDDILKRSNNLVSETAFKLAGAKHLGLETGSDIAGVKMFNDYCIKNKLDNSKIRITDASGVSKNNLISADFVTEFLLVNKNNKVMDRLPIPGEGTLTHRMLAIKDNLKAKTGTLSDISSIAGYLTTRNGKKYAFCIMINDTTLSASDKKMLEDFIIREAYMNM